MPGRLSRERGRHGRGGEREIGGGHVNSPTKEQNKGRDDVRVEARRLSTQCPTPPTDPFPDFDSTPTGAPVSNIPDTFKVEQAIGKPGSLGAMNRPGLPLDGPSLDGPSLDGPSLDGPSIEGGPLSPQGDGSAKPQSEQQHTGGMAKSRTQSSSSIRKLSASQMQALASSPDSLPVAVVTTTARKPSGGEYPLSAGVAETIPSMAEQLQDGKKPTLSRVASNSSLETSKNFRRTAADFQRPSPSMRTLSTPPIDRRPPPSSSGPGPAFNRRNSSNPPPRPTPLNINGLPGPTQTSSKAGLSQATEPSEPRSSSPILPTIPLPPMSLPTHLQLELAGQRPSPLYIHHAQPVDTPYESSAVKFERLKNALLLPPYLEQIMYFGTLACLDAWLYTFTILPMRFVSALGVLVRWWLYVIWKEVRWMVAFVWSGIGRLWRRGRRGAWSSRVPSGTNHNQAHDENERSQSRPRRSSSNAKSKGANRHRKVSDTPASSLGEQQRPNSNGVFHPPKHVMPRPGHFRHRRTKSMPSSLTSYHKADLLQGAILICSSIALMDLDASRMYHFIRAQSSMKLYVIYNILEVADRLLSAIGQDILECLFSSETLSRNSSGRSKVLLPFGMFVLSLIYNVIHTWCLFYQVITLNVAVNSYSNSLLTLLISNQFVEIKGSVFKKIEKENLFQLTCSDVVERFQTWIILLIIGMRNVVEVGGLSIPGAGSVFDGQTGPLHTPSILPASFTVLPSWLRSGEVLSPFVVVIGMEMIVDWIKHAYINKFNNVKPTIYRRMLDVLCKDYYTNAFSAPSLTRRLGLPLLPLSSLFIRASFQVYHMFLSTHIPSPIPTSTTELSVESSTPSSPAMVAAFEQLDTLIRHALGRAVYGYAHEQPNDRSRWEFSSDDVIALLTMVVFFFLAWIVLLIFKLFLGMLLLRYSHRRYATMKLKEHAIATGKAEHENFSQPGLRVGAFSSVEIGEERRKWIYEDDPEGLARMRERERKTQEKFKEKVDDGLAKVVRYEMVAKRIW
ncbi:DUF747-domain-containing protein [Poronia punctata]|nr:DUF747-domain-containing protein [Poronia punctata]